MNSYIDDDDEEGFRWGFRVVIFLLPLFLYSDIQGLEFLSSHEKLILTSVLIAIWLFLLIIGGGSGIALGILIIYISLWKIISSLFDQYATFSDWLIMAIAVFFIEATVVLAAYAFFVFKLHSHRKIFYLGISIFYIWFQVLFSIIYYAIYATDNLSFTFLQTEFRNREKLIDKYMNLIVENKKRLNACGYAIQLLQSEHVKKRQEDAHYNKYYCYDIVYFFNWINEPFLVMGICEDDENTWTESKKRYGLDDLIIRIDSQEISYPLADIPFSLHYSMNRNVAYDAPIDSAKIQLNNLLLELSEIYQNRLNKLNDTLKNFDNTKIKTGFIDFILFSFNTSSSLGHGIIVPNNLLTKTITVSQVILTIVTMIMLVNIYESNKHKKVVQTKI